jgi:hypothetical protein
MELCKGSRVLTPAGRGTVTDRSAGESLVKLDAGDYLDTSHGRWHKDGALAVIGWDPEAMVWSGSRMRRAAELKGWS